VLKRTNQLLPKWKDEAGVAALVEEYIRKQGAIAEHFSEFGREHEYDQDDDGFVFAEKAAVEVAKRGHLAALVELLRGEHRDWLQPDTVELMIEFMTGKRNPQTGRRKGERKVGASKMTQEERLAHNPIHGAAIEFGVIRNLLKRLYPAEPPRKISKRARELAAKRAGVTVEQLYGYHRRPRSDTAHRLG
jgi:hypothetical protein